MTQLCEFDERSDVPLHRRRGGSTDLAMASLGTPLLRINDFIYLSPGVTNAHLITTSEGDVVVSTGLAVEGMIHRGHTADTRALMNMIRDASRNWDGSEPIRPITSLYPR